MKHFGTDIIRGIDLYQSEGARQFCSPSHTVLSLLRGEMRVRAGEKNFSFAGSGIILIPSGRKTDLFCEQSAVFLLILHFFPPPHFYEYAYFIPISWNATP